MKNTEIVPPPPNRYSILQKRNPAPKCLEVLCLRRARIVPAICFMYQQTDNFDRVQTEGHLRTCYNRLCPPPLEDDIE